jgi:hypothetical protein
MTPLLSTQEQTPESSAPHLPQMEDDRLSWMALFKSALDPKFSTPPEEFGIAISNIFNNKTASALTFDIVSLMERPEENKYIDLRIRGGSKGFVFEIDNVETGNAETGSKFSKTTAETEPDEQLTVDKINKLLCKSKDCPAARKFKEFGIGPLANTKGLGAVIGDTSIPLTYGISQTYGVFDEYGPYGLFSKPKRPENPFTPKQDNDWSATCWKPKRRKEDKEKKTCPCNCTCQKHHPPLRLTGGGVLDYDDVKSPFHECKEVMDQFDEVLAKYKKAIGPCGKVTCPFAPNVAKESCKKMCQHPDDVYSVDYPLEASPTEPEPETPPAPPTKKFKPKGACGSPKCAYAKYKTGLVDEDAEMELQYLPQAPSGKCGHPKCPYPVEPELPPIHWDCPDPLPKGRCKNPECPYLPKEIKCLNAVLAKGVCGNYNCPFSVPDPCSSPTCPFASKECPYQKGQTDSESFCGISDCPYAPNKKNSLCDNPDCPFAKKSDTCDNPTCPYAKKECPRPPPCYMPPCGDNPCYPPPCGTNPCGMPPCYMPPCGDSPCPMSPCPYVTNPYLQNLLAYYSLATGNNDLLQICFGGPECPLTNASSPCQSPCESPRCPYETKQQAQSGVCGGTCSKPAPKTCKKPSPCYIPVNSACGNPSCPYGTKVDPQDAGSPGRRSRGLEDTAEHKEGDIEIRSDTRTDVDLAPCYPTTCKMKGGKLECDACKTNDTCGNLECPYAPKKTCYIKPPPCYVPPDDDACDNPDCPYAPKTCYSKSPPCGAPPCYPPPCGASPCPSSPCGTPPCPMMSSPCPYGLNPYLQSLLAYCLPLSICPDGTCPYPVRDLLQICFGGPECPLFRPPQPCIVEDKSVKDDVCENPECPYAKGDDASRKDKQSVKDESPDGVEYTSDTRVEMDFRPCTTETCKSQGGELICSECPCGGGEAGGDNEVEYKSETRTDVDMAPCNKKTCSSKGGTLVCDVCPCAEGGDGKKKKVGGRKKKRKSRNKYVYSIGDKYPGVQVGHRECVMPACNVPPGMGWLWNIFTPCMQLKVGRKRRVAKSMRTRYQFRSFWFCFSPEEGGVPAP